MNNSIKKLSLLILLTGLFVSCKKEFGPLSDIKPAVPVTVTNASEFRPEPTVYTSISGGGTITITLSIPANSPRTIKEITKVAAATTYTQIQSTGATGFYNTAPLAGSGKSITFTTTLAQYVTLAAGTIPAVNTELAKRFYFLITFDDGSQVVTEPVRVLVLS